MVKMWTRGRLGNICFQVATLVSYALDHDMRFTINDTTNDPVMQPLYFQELVNSKWDANRPSKWVREMQHNYSPLLWEEDWRDYNIQFINGYYQSELYFKHRREDILELFLYWIPYTRDERVSIHCRLGDYLTIEGKHILNTDGNYMLDSTNRFIKQGYDEFLVFSDNIEFCKEYFKKLPGKYYFSEGNDPLTDLSLMSGCAHQINSSSTLSWWAAWMNQNPMKQIVTPKEWFQSTQPENTNDIIPENWIKL